jgi:hypothetical protein
MRKCVADPHYFDAAPVKGKKVILLLNSAKFKTILHFDAVLAPASAM